MQPQDTCTSGRMRTSAVGKLDRSATHRQQRERCFPVAPRYAACHTGTQFPRVFRARKTEQFRLVAVVMRHRSTTSFTCATRRAHHFMPECSPADPPEAKRRRSENVRPDKMSRAPHYFDLLRASDDSQSLSRWCSRDLPRRKAHEGVGS